MHHGEIRLSVQLFLIIKLQDSPGSGKTTHCLARSGGRRVKMGSTLPDCCLSFSGYHDHWRSKEWLGSPQTDPRSAVDSR